MTNPISVGAHTLCLAALLATTVSPVGAQGRMAVTIDDVPWVGTVPAGGVPAATDRLLATLTERSIPAIGFVVCDRMGADSPSVRAWLASGMTIGSHSAAHRDLNSGLDPWIEDVRRCDAELAEITGTHGGYFRFPYLHQGPTVAIRDEAARRLDALGYRTAHVSIDNSEWVLASAYGRAIEREDAPEMERIGRAYVDYMLEAAAHFATAAIDKFGRDIDHVLLIHANALNADWLGAVLDAYSEAGWTFVDLDTALADPVYALADGYVGPRGLSWVYRAAPVSPEDPWDESKESELRARFGD